jgi:hypothetical protein
VRAQMRNPLKLAITATLFVVLGFSLYEFYHLARYGHLAPLGLHSDIVVRRGDIGIPGISKLYEARLTNYGVRPVKVMACDFISDAFERGRIVAYAIERWNPLSRVWDTVIGYDQSAFCRPYPLGIAEAHLVSKRLWPGQSISTGDDATAARDTFVLGDKARFIVLGDGAGHRETAFPTTLFPIDEYPLYSDVPLRIRH